MKKQRVIRTYSRNFMTTVENLERALLSGWVVIFITKLNEDIIEYIVEKEK